MFTSKYASPPIDATRERPYILITHCIAQGAISQRGIKSRHNTPSESPVNFEITGGKAKSWLGIKREIEKTEGHATG